MHKFGEVFTKHPYLIGGAVIGGALLIYIMFRTPSVTPTATASTGVDPYLANAQINAQLVATQDAISGQTNQAQFALEANQNNNQTQVALASLQDQTSIQGAQLNASYELQSQASSNQVSTLQLATAAALQSQDTNLAADLQSQQLANTHFNDVYNDFNSFGAAAGGTAIIAAMGAAAVAGNPYGESSYTATNSGPLGNTAGYWGYAMAPLSDYADTLPTSTSVDPTSGSAVQDYTSTSNNLLSSIFQSVTPGDPTATDASHLSSLPGFGSFSLNIPSLDPSGIGATA